MKKYFLFLSLMFAFGGFSQTFPFYLPYSDSSNQTFLPAFQKQPLKDGEFISIDKGSFTLNNQIIKFWGSNLVANGAFPAHSDADYAAARMRKMGFNLMRLHHMDNAWGGPSLFYNTPNTRTINETYRDRLEYLIAKMKEQGIFVDVNLLVSRMFRTSDGVANADSITDFSYWKTPALFDPQLISLQKEYAKNLLTHVNPYIGKELVDDPVMAMTEIANENSIFRDWMNGTLKSFADGGTLLFRDSYMLDTLWNTFLKNKYGNTVTLQNSWNQGSNTNTTNLLTNGDFETGTNAGWSIEQYFASKGTLVLDNTVKYQGNFSGKFTITNYDDTTWHCQLKQTGLSVQQDSVYEIDFYAKTDNPITIIAYVSLDVSPWDTYSSNTFDISTDWKKYSFTFKAPASIANNIRLAFNYTANGTVWFDNIFFGAPTISGLATGETIENSTVKRIEYKDRLNYSDNRVKDQVSFYLNIERDFFSNMRSYLKDTLGVKTPVTGSNWFSGTEDFYTQEGMDYIDNHAYWDHPQFPDIAWDPINWFIKNQPMMKSPDFGTIPNIFSGFQMKNKPFTISEYNHPYPNQYQSEMLPMITSYAAFNGADAIMFFDYNSADDWQYDALTSYFDIQRNNAIMAAMPVFGYAFRNNLINESSASTELSYSQDDIFGFSKTNDQPWWTTRLPFSNNIYLTNKIVTDSFTSNTSIYSQTLPTEPQNPYISSNSQFTWDTLGSFTINTNNFISIAGSLNNFKNKQAGNLTLTDADGFGSVAWLSLDSAQIMDTKRSIIVLNKYQENTNMTWYNNNSTLKNTWGNAPTLQDPLNVKLRLNLNAKALRVYQLDSSGKENLEHSHLYAPSSQGIFDIELNQNVDKTLWYGLQSYDSDSMLSIKNSLEKNSFLTMKIIGNPAKDFTTIRYNLPEDQIVKLSIFNQIGDEVAIPMSSNNLKGIHDLTLDTSTLEGGIYFCVLKTQKGTIVQKLIVVK